MDSVSFNRPISRGIAPLGGSISRPADSLDAIQQDALRLSGLSATPYTASMAGGVSNAAAVSQRVKQDAFSAYQAGDRVRAQLLINFASVIDSLAGDPVASGALAQAYLNPNSSDASRRLAATFLSADPNPTACLLGLVSFDGPNSSQWRAAYSNNVFSSGTSGAEVAADLIKQVADPSGISQGNRQTCGAASTQILLAREAPGELIRLVTSLAVGSAAKLKNGEMIQLPANWNFQGDGNRTVASRLIQTAFMEYANGNASYDNIQDVSADYNGEHQGLQGSEMTRLLAGVTTRQTQMVQYQQFNGNWSNSSYNDPLQDIVQSTSKGWSVPVLLWVQQNQAYGHYEMVENVSNYGVTLLNPWGMRETMSPDQFRQRLVAAFYQ